MSLLGNIFKTDSQKLTEAVTGLESLSSQFDELATSVAANAIDSDEFNFRGAAQAIANNISMAGQKVKAASSFITDVMNTQEDLQSSMVFKFEDYISEAETALEIKVTDGVNVNSPATSNGYYASSSDGYSGSSGGSYGGSSGGGYSGGDDGGSDYSEPDTTPEPEDDADDPGEVTTPIGTDTTIDSTVESNLTNKFGENGFTDQAIKGIINEAKDGTNVTSTIAENGNGYGIFKWNDERKANLFKFAEEKGLDPSNVDVQMDFAIAEMTEGSGYTNSQALLVKGLINNAPTVKDAQYLWKTYFVGK